MENKKNKLLFWMIIFVDVLFIIIAIIILLSHLIDPQKVNLEFLRHKNFMSIYQQFINM